MLAELGAAPLVTPARAVAVVAVAMALVAGGFAVTGPRAPALCSTAASELDGVWDDGVEAEVRASFDATGARYASCSDWTPRTRVARHASSRMSTQLAA